MKVHPLNPQSSAQFYWIAEGYFFLRSWNSTIKPARGWFNKHTFDFVIYYLQLFLTLPTNTTRRKVFLLNQPRSCAGFNSIFHDLNKETLLQWSNKTNYYCHWIVLWEMAGEFDEMSSIHIAGDRNSPISRRTFSNLFFCERRTAIRTDIHYFPSVESRLQVWWLEATRAASRRVITHRLVEWQLQPYCLSLEPYSHSIRQRELSLHWWSSHIECCSRI